MKIDNTGFLNERINSYGQPITLGAKQELFSLLALKLQLFMIESGFSIRLGHALRCDNCPTGAKHSNHKIKLALDINLFKNGVYLTTTEAHKKFGEFWESLHPLCRWGGRFNDGNHYSFEHHGRK